MKADIVLVNISNLITMDGKNAPWTKEDMKNVRSVENGIVAIKDDRIVYVGSGELPEEIETDKFSRVIDCTGQTVVPGFVDSHTHLVHGGSRENELAMKLSGMGYLDILAQGGGIHSTVKATKEADFDTLYKKASASLDTMLSFGVTTVEAKSGYGLDDFETELRQLKVAKALNDYHPVDVVSTFMPAHAIPKPFKDNPQGYIDLMINEYLPKVKEENLAEFLDVFCEEGVFTVEESRKIMQAGKELGYHLKIHADEIIPLGGAELAAEMGAVTAEHLIAASDEGIQAMAKAGVIADLLPGTSFNLQKNTFARAKKMIEEGVAVALSTDYNPGSCPTENLQLIMSFAGLCMKLSPEEVLAGVTMNGACAIKREHEIGSISVGKKADITVLKVPNISYLIYHFGINHTSFVIKNGKIFC